MHKVNVGAFRHYMNCLNEGKVSEALSKWHDSEFVSELIIFRMIISYLIKMYKHVKLRMNQREDSENRS